MTDNRKRQPRGIPTGGEFAANMHDEAAGTMRGRPASEAFEDALNQWGLSEGDVPGIGSAWDERFAMLNDDTIVGAPVIAAQALKLHDRYEIEGNIQVDRRGDTAEVEFEDYGDGDEDDDGYRYRNPTTYRIPITDPEVNAKVLAALDDQDRVNQRDALLRESVRYRRGEAPVWHLLADPDEVAAASKELSEAIRSRQDKYAVESAEAFDGSMSRLREIVASGALTQDDYRANFHAKLSPKVGGEHSGERGMDFNSTAKSLIENKRRIAKAERMEEAMASAKALPDGALKDFLIGEREERSYNTTEGTGRNKRTVVKKYTPESELVSDHESALKARASSMKEVAEIEEKLSAWGTEHAESRREYAAREVRHQEALSAWRNLGWTGSGEPPQRVVEDSGF